MNYLYDFSFVCNLLTSKLHYVDRSDCSWFVVEIHGDKTCHCFNSFCSFVISTIQNLRALLVSVTQTLITLIYG